MTFAVNVKGGTGAGRRKPPKEKPSDWTCACGEHRPGYLKSCIACKQERPA